MFDIVKYTGVKSTEWNEFVAKSKNGTFLFDRRYMDYHADRFMDNSLMVYRKGKLFALLPANRVGDVLCSHQGLSYGGLILGNDSKTADVQYLMEQLNEFLRTDGMTRVVYKHIPWPYATHPAEEDLYALHYACRASLVSRDVTSIVTLDNRLPFSTLRKRQMKKAANCRLEVCQSDDFASFWSVLEKNLYQRFHAKPVHTLQEIERLKENFRDNIRLYVVSSGNAILGGTVLYVHRHIVKSQYISACKEGKKLGALDLLFARLLDHFETEGFQYFDFGTSNLLDDSLNETLLFQKEGFGGRAVCYDTYEWTL